MAKTGVLGAREKGSIQIEHFIFHIIRKDDDRPRFLVEVELTPAQRTFFSQRIADSAEGTQYVFRDKVEGTTARRCQRIISDPESTFLDESRHLTTDFKEQHRGNVSDGVFVIALFTAEMDGARVPMIALIKMDHRRVLEYVIEETDEGRKAVMKEIMNSFVEERAAVQKSAIIDISENYEWDILASERSNRIGIAAYFRLFLYADERQSPSTLTRNSITAVGAWAKGHKGQLLEPARAYRQRAIQFMEDNDNFETERFLEVVVHDKDDERKQVLMDSLRVELEERGIAGQRFSPSPASIPGKDKKNKVQTAEGVTIIWQGSDEAANIDISKEPGQDGMYTIMIKTQYVKD